MIHWFFRHITNGIWGKKNEKNIEINDRYPNLSDNGF